MKKVYCFDLDRMFTSATDASRQLNISRSSITDACRGRLQSAGGLWWCYAEDKDLKFKKCLTCV